MNTFVLIFWIASIVILLLAALVGVLGGLRRGPLRGLVKLLALVVSVALSLVIALCLRGVAMNILRGLLTGFVPQELQDYTKMIELVMNIPASIALLIAFWPIFTVVRLLMLIPQKLICKLLPDQLSEPAPKQKKVQEAALTPAPAAEELSAPVMAEAMIEPESDTPSEETAEYESHALSEETTESVVADEDFSETDETLAVVDAAETEDEAPALSAVEEEQFAPSQEVAEPAEEKIVFVPAKRSIGVRILWNAGAVILGVLSSVLMVCAVIMPVSCMISRVGDSLSRVTAVMAEEEFGEYSEEISEISRGVVSSPLLVTTDFVYGKTVFDPITSFSTDYGRISLSHEMKMLTTVTCDVLPVYLHIDQDGELKSNDDELVADAVKQVADSDFLMAVGTFAVQTAAEDFKLFKEGDEMTPAKETLQASITDLLEDTTPETLAAHLETVADLVIAAGDSELLKTLMADEAKEMKIADFADRETLGEVFGVLYDDDAVRELLVPVINFGAETIFLKAGIQPVYADVDLDDYSRKEVVAEADVLCDAILYISEFVESIEEGGNNLSAYRLTSAGKALDSLKRSIIFGACYDELVQALTAMNNGYGAETDQLLSSITDALKKSDSAEKLMNSAQSVIVLGDQLQKGEKKGSENQELVSSLDTLLNQTDKESTEILADLAEDVFEGRSDGIGSEQKTQMIQDCVKALNSIDEADDVDTAVEADAVQVIYNLTHSDANAFENVSEKETVDSMLDSKLAMAVVNILNDEGRDYGVKKNMNAENKANILAALAESDADEASKNAIAQFFGVQ